MRSRIKPLLAAITVYGILSVTVIYECYLLSERHFVYPLDDTYIHLAIAKNIAQHGVFGTSPFEFASAASSVVWPWLLAFLFKVIGQHLLLPLVLNLIFGVAVLILLTRDFQSISPAQSDLRLFLLLLAFCLFVPLPTMSMIAMEHVLHVLATLWFARAVSRPAPETSSAELALSAILLTGARYEGLFLVAAAAVIFLTQWRWSKAILVCAAGWLLPTLQGLYSLAHGSYFLPNSLLVKAGVYFGPAAHIFSAFEISSSLVAWVIAAFVLLLVTEGERVPLKLFLITAALHCALANGGWLWRYEAYLVGLGIWSCWRALAGLNLRLSMVARFSLAAFLAGIWIAGAVVHESFTLATLSRISIGIAATFLAVFVLALLLITQWHASSRRLAQYGYLLALLLLMADPAGRAYSSIVNTPAASREIYLQSIQVAQFTRKYLPGANVVLHDIGAVSYYADVHTLDSVGLGSPEVVALMRRHDYNADTLDEISRSRGMQFAIIYTSLFPKPLPLNWFKVAEWRLGHAIILADTTMTFYAIGRPNADYLSAKLADYSHELPKAVAVQRFYLPPQATPAVDAP